MLYTACFVTLQRNVELTSFFPFIKKEHYKHFENNRIHFTTSVLSGKITPEECQKKPLDHHHQRLSVLLSDRLKLLAANCFHSAIALQTLLKNHFSKRQQGLKMC